MRHQVVRPPLGLRRVAFGPWHTYIELHMQVPLRVIATSVGALNGMGWTAPRMPVMR